jgi:DNA polymerase-3 subunit alpha
MTDSFVERKHGREKIDHMHPSLEKILEPTYGVMVYQEQVMEIARVLSGYTLGGADILRRAMGKKSESEMASQRSKFIDGASANNVSEKISTKIFDGIQDFAKYAFNKSHSAAYALIAYQTAWLKTHYPSQFMAAVMSADMDHTEKVVIMLEESHKIGLKVLPPDINSSNYKFVASSDEEIIYGLGAIKGVGEAAIELILEERKKGMFTDLHDFCKRMDGSKVNKRVIESMIRAGAMDSIVPLVDGDKSWQGRSTLLASMSTAIRFAEQENKNKDSGQNDMFQMDDAEIDKRFSYIKSKVWSEDERLYGERNTLGLFLTGHPINQYKNDLDNFISNKIGDIDKSSRNVRFAGLLIEIRIRNTKQGKKIAILKLDDRSGQIEVALFTKSYDEYQHLLQMDEILIIEGKVRDDDFTGGFRVMVERIMDFNTARAEYVKYIQISYKKTKIDVVGQLQSALKPFVDNKCPVKINYMNQDGTSNIWLGKEWRVMPATELLTRLNDLSWVDDASLYYN